MHIVTWNQFAPGDRLNRDQGFLPAALLETLSLDERFQRLIDDPAFAPLQLFSEIFAQFQRPAGVLRWSRSSPLLPTNECDVLQRI